MRFSEGWMGTPHRNTKESIEESVLLDGLGLTCICPKADSSLHEKDSGAYK